VQVFEDEEEWLPPTRLEPELRQQRHETGFAGFWTQGGERRCLLLEPQEM
jgi:hypothetical protein